MTENIKDDIKTEQVISCPVCSSNISLVLYQNLEDKLFGAKGKWNIKQCKECLSLFSDPRPLMDEMYKVYEGYSVHQQEKLEITKDKNSILAGIKKFVKLSFLSFSKGYKQNIPRWYYCAGFILYNLFPFKRDDILSFAMFLPAYNKGRLLDVGCGGGAFLKNMQSLGWVIEGVDIDTKSVEIARSAGIQVKQGELEEQNYPADHFDAIVLKHVIEHVSDPFSLIKECFRILKPGGKIIVLTPNIESLGHQYFKNSWRGLEPPRHLILFNLDSLCKVVSDTGFKIEESRTTARSAEFMWNASRKQINKEASLNNRLLAKLFKKREQIMVTFVKNKGEELLIIARK